MTVNQAVAAVGGAVTAWIVGYHGFHMDATWSVLLALAAGATLAGITGAFRSRR